MTNYMEKLEGLLGGKLERKEERVIPGTVSVAGAEFVYFSDNGKEKFRKQFKRLTEFSNPPSAKYGGINERGCKITLPNGLLFHAIGYHGDLDGWRKDLEAGAEACHFTLARIEGAMFAVSDGSSFALDKCKIDFD